ncbi:MAG TPA: polymorphic toxin-type HINT domain-containing protein [Polyangia bacterium]|nr:polymorphic toxin-type HINT domain-containing protein [Polyangia bacterium]
MGSPWRHRRRRKTRGASGIEYVVVVILVAITGISGYKMMGAKYRCKVSQATGLFALTDEKGAAVNCDDDGSGAQASNSPPPSADNSGSAGPTPGITCVGNVCEGDNCFVAGTLILTEDGARPIESITAGTRVLSRDQEGDDIEWKPVARTFVRRTNQLVELTIGDPDTPETIDVTPSHRIHAKGRGWVDADSLVPGADLLVDASGRDVQILGAEEQAVSVNVYNMEVEDFHTYYVGEHEFWAHNTCPAHPWQTYTNCAGCGTLPPPPQQQQQPTFYPPSNHNVNPCGDGVNCFNAAIAANHYMNTGQQSYGHTNPYGTASHSPYTLNQQGDLDNYTGGGRQSITFNRASTDPAQIYNDIGSALPKGQRFTGIVSASNSNNPNGHAFNVTSDGQGDVTFWDPQTHTGFNQKGYSEQGQFKPWGPGNHPPAWASFDHLTITDATNPTNEPPAHRVSSNSSQGYVSGRTYHFRAGRYYSSTGQVFDIPSDGNWTVP